jgi:predicted ATPase
VPVMFVALAHPELLRARPGWGGGFPAYTALPLEALGTTDSIDLATRLFASVEQDAFDADALEVVEMAEGNPLFIEELAATVIERPGTAVHELPGTIRELVSRLDSLTATERPVLLDASVVGRVFWRDALEHMSGDTARVSEALDSLEARDLIRREPLSWISGEEQYAFKHMLIREVAYATLPRAARRERHAAVAGFLEAATAGAAATSTALAQHWREAGDSERAVGYLLRAAEQAGRGWAKEEAAALYKQALELIPESDRGRRREIGRRQALALASIIHVADTQLLARRSDLETRPG